MYSRNSNVAIYILYALYTVLTIIIYTAVVIIIARHRPAGGLKHHTEVNLKQKNK